MSQTSFWPPAGQLCPPGRLAADRGQAAGGRL